MISYRDILFVTVTLHLFASGRTIGVSSKLDFGDSGDSSSLTSTNTQLKISGPPGIYKVESKNSDKPSDGFGDIGVVCVSGGCNKTEDSADSKDVIKTDVVVHVETKVNLKNENKSFIDDTPDIPVVLGVKGTNLDPYNSADSNPIYIPGAEPNVHTLEANKPVTGVTTHTIVQLNKENNGFKSMHKIPGVYAPYPPRSGNGMFPSTFSGQPQSKLGSSFDSYPSITVSMNEAGNNFKEIKYQSNGIELHQVPYLESSFHNFYQGEHPPQQLVWYPRSATYNPVEFRNTVNTQWKPSNWQQMLNEPQYYVYKSAAPRVGVKSETCTCKNQQNGRDLHWYPNRRLHNNDPGSQINDKLAPLN